jgi:hypothetical protein
MSLLKTYSVVNDIAAGAVNTGKLHKEILASGFISGFNGLAGAGGNLKVLGTVILDEPALDTLIQNHDPDESGDEVKQWKYMENVEDKLSAPLNKNIRTEINIPGQGRLEHIKTLSKGDYGDYQSKVYYSDGASKTDAVVRRDFSYAYNHSIRQVTKEDLWAWYKEDNTLHEDTKLVKTWFEGMKYMRFMEVKRHEIIIFLKYWVEQSMGYNASANNSSPLYNWTFAQLDAEGKRFLKEYDSVIGAFIDGASQSETGSFSDKLTNETDFTWLADEVVPTLPNRKDGESIKDFMLMEIDIPMEAPAGDPTGITVQSLVATQVDVDWTNNASAADRYVVERSTDATNWAHVAYSWNLTSYTDTGLTPGQTYYYRVKAYNPLGSTGWTTSAAVTVLT